MKLKSICVAALSLSGLLLPATSAQAQSFEAVRLQRTAPGQDLAVIGLVALSSPTYAGADGRRAVVLPLLDFQWASGWFAGVSNGFGINLSSDPQWQYGLRITADVGRKEKRAEALRGMGNIDPKLEGGAFLNLVLPSGWQATTSLRYGSGIGGGGLVADVGLGYSTALAPQWMLGLGAALSVVNADYMQSYFGVSASQAPRSGYAAYTPSAGLRDVRANGSLTYALDRRSAVTAAASVSRLAGDAADSPLTRKRNLASAVVVYTHAF